MTSEKGSKKEKNQNIQVFVRLRPLNQRERDIKSLGVVEVANNREVVVRQSQQTSLTKRFTFDRAFGPNAKQVEVYQDVVSPLIEEVLSGYNCTVFAYGQTGTGKTHTMVGEHSSTDSTWQSDPLAGIIPRALSQLFDELRITNTEYTVRVSYLELYNEELFDLLSTSEDNSKLRIYEDVSRKGSNIVNGLEEITVYNKNEVYKIMTQGQERKRVASTLMNAQSSRSHTVFTIVVHMKENSSEGEEMMKIGKLNLVDLAGSENISKAGSDNPAKKERARECVNINQSLLTLGRVITALVERHPHIPYRESKLTRILQESLGGKTKTSIIATISPGHKDLEETMSTLEYAHRAKNIQNKPEVNQKLTKKAILKEFSEEIDRLKRDLYATREKNGVYLASETYAELTLKDEEQRKEIQELLLKKRAMEDERDRMESIFAELEQQLQQKGSELEAATSQLDSTRVQLANTNNVLRSTKMQCEEQQQLVRAHHHTEVTLGAQARQLVEVADQVTRHATALHDSLDKRRTLESSNLEVTQSFRAQSQEQREHITDRLQQYTDTLLNAVDQLHSTLENFNTNSTALHEEQQSTLTQIIDSLASTLNQMKSLSRSSSSRLGSWSEQQQQALRQALGEHSAGLGAALAGLQRALAASGRGALAALARGDVAGHLRQWHSGAAARVASLQQSHARYRSRAGAGDERRRLAAQRQRQARRQLAHARLGDLSAGLLAMEKEVTRRESRIQRIIDDAKTERQRGDERIQSYMERERRLLEERLARYHADETKILDEILTKRLKDTEEETTIVNEQKSRLAEFKLAFEKTNNEEIMQADKDLEEFECGAQEFNEDLTKYNKEFDEGTSAVSADMEVLTENVASLAAHLTDELTQLFNETNQLAEQEANKLISADKVNADQFLATMAATFEEIITTNQQSTEEFINDLESHSRAAAEPLQALREGAGAARAAVGALLGAQAGELCAARRGALQLAADVRAALRRWRQLEDKYLADDYRLYSPTGQTPQRTQYQFPRALAATSPHDRILARFRASRQTSADDDCVLIESDSESRGVSDSDSTVSEEGIRPAAVHTPAIFKSTSETDIYQRRKQEQTGKENADHSICYKKPSKLPARSTIKRPLIERNLN